MKTPKPLIFFISITLMISCIKKPPEAVTKLFIKNNSSHLIEGNIYLDGNIIKNFSINTSDRFVIENKMSNSGSLMFVPFDTADSLIISFDNQYHITHYRLSNQNQPVRNMFQLSNWESLKEVGNYYEYRYTFSDDDYTEAVNQP